MTLFLLIKFSLQANPPPTSDVKSILSWIIGVLIVFIIALVTYFKVEKKILNDLLKEESLFFKNQYTENVKSITNNTNILEQVVKGSDKTNDVIIEIKPVVKDNNERLKALNTHIKNGN